MEERIKEGESIIRASRDAIPSKRMDVFYNPVMKHNRDISILILYLLEKKDIKVALPLCGSGVRGIRFLKELQKESINIIYFNDANPTTTKILSENIKANEVEKKSIVSNKKADEFFASSEEYYDYIDIDPFGSPIYFIANAIRKMKNHSILALTATDTSSLCGSYPKVCRRRYFAEPINNSLMYETGVRILIASAQKEGARYDINLKPIFSYYKDHYIRVFFSLERSKSNANNSLKEHQYLHFNKEHYNIRIQKENNSKTDFVAGPLWTGKLFETSLIDKLQKRLNDFEENNKLFPPIKRILEDSALKRFLERICEEKDAPPFYKDLHQIAKTYKIELKPIDAVIKGLKEEGFYASRTHFLNTAIKTDAPTKEIIKTMKKK